MSAIPKLSRGDILKACRQIDRDGIPSRRRATRFHLSLGGRLCPPKLVVSLAAAIATGKALRSGTFSGGEETNRVIEALGFVVVGGRRPANSNAAAIVSARQDHGITIARVVLKGQPSGSAKAAAAMLSEAFDQCAFDGKAMFTITPGGFVTATMPRDWQGGLGWDSRRSDLPSLIRLARPAVQEVLSSKVVSAARKRTRALTIGIDLMADSSDMTANVHAELVATVDATTGKVINWTGKSYPVPSQEHTLVHVTDLRSHFIRVAGERILILGCHDLNMFSSRARANQKKGGLRDLRCSEMIRLARAFRPTLVLQHPHSTDSAQIWRMPWMCLQRELPSVRAWACGVAHHRWGRKPRRPLRAVMRGTKSVEGVFDVIVSAR